MLQFKFYLAAWCFTCMTTPTFPARILGIFTLESVSHFAFDEAIMKSLVAAGHQVTLIAPFKPQYSHVNFTVIDSKIENVNPLAGVTLSWYTLMTHVIEALENDCYRVMSMDEVKALDNFDVVFVEILPMCRCYFPIARKLGVPIVGTTSHLSLLYAESSVAIPRFPAILPPEGGCVDAGTSFYKRLLNFLLEATARMVFIMEERRLEKFYKTMFPGQEQSRLEISWLFTNNHANLMPRPLVPNAVDVGGIHAKLAELNPLPEPLKTFIEGPSHGVLLFSLGTIFSHQAITAETINILQNTFAKIPQRVIFKVDRPVEGFSSNVYLSQWVPQKEILAHPNVLGFISHCGASSMYETIYFAKPVIAVPIFADQMNNAAILEKIGVAVTLNVEQLTEAELMQAISDVINGSRYRENMQLLSRKFKDELNSPAEEVVYWTEYVMRYNGSSDRRFEAVGMPLYQYLFLDVIAFIVVFVISAMMFIFLFVRYTIKKLFGFKKNKILATNKKIL